MYNSIIVIHSTPHINPLLRIIVGELSVHRRLIRVWHPDLVFVRLLTFDMFEETLFVETGIVTTWDCDFVVVDAIWSSTVDTEFAGN